MRKEESAEPKRKRGRPRKNPEAVTQKPEKKERKAARSYPKKPKITMGPPENIAELKAAFQMDETQIMLSNGVVVRKEQVLAICESYISSLDNPESIYTKTATFRGMLKQIYISLFKPPLNYSPFYNKIHVMTLLDHENIKSLDIVFSWYTELAYKYNNNISLLAYCLMTGVSRDVIDNWRTETSRPNSEHSRTVKKWLKECELSAFDNASNGNPGGMFILKACFGYTEQPQQIVISNGNSLLPQETIEQIAQKRQKEPLSLPERPLFDE